jgi:hypothetical protein
LISNTFLFLPFGLTFSGVDFLFGSNRELKLSETMLFIGWIILYISAIAIRAWAMSFNISSLLKFNKAIGKIPGSEYPKNEYPKINKTGKKLWK